MDMHYMANCITEMFMLKYVRTQGSWNNYLQTPSEKSRTPRLLPHAIHTGHVETRYTDDFGIEYFNTKHLGHLVTALSKNYTILVDTARSEYCGLHFDWHSDLGYDNVCMPGYIANILQMSQHYHPAKAQHVPHKWTVPTCGNKAQFVM